MESILAEIDATLDQLIQNAKSIQEISLKQLQTHEIDALQKTQESLLAHLIHMDKLLDKDQKKTLQETNLKEKVLQYHRLNQQMMKQMVGNFATAKPAKRNKKRIETKI